MTLQKRSTRPAFGLARALSLILAGTLLVLAGGCSNVPVARQAMKNTRFHFALIGDMPYAPEAITTSFPNLIADLNRSRLAFVVHDGDIKSGASPCTDETFTQVREQFQSIEHPLIYVFGDNEWTDCKEPYVPEERLDKLREMFTEGDHSLGRHALHLERQSNNPEFQKFRENVRWVYGDILFVGLHLTGSDNNFGKPEFDERNAANLAWTKDSFAEAARNGNRAILLVIQANPLFDRPPRERRGFNDFLRVLETETVAFANPVVLVHGDTHYYRIDKPMLGPRSRRRIENFTRVETFGHPDVHWIEATADWRDPNVFTFRPCIVGENQINHK